MLELTACEAQNEIGLAYIGIPNHHNYRGIKGGKGEEGAMHGIPAYRQLHNMIDLNLAKVNLFAINLYLYVSHNYAMYLKTHKMARDKFIAHCCTLVGALSL